MIEIFFTSYFILNSHKYHSMLRVETLILQQLWTRKSTCRNLELQCYMKFELTARDNVSNCGQYESGFSINDILLFFNIIKRKCKPFHHNKFKASNLHFMWVNNMWFILTIPNTNRWWFIYKNNVSNMDILSSL